MTMETGGEQANSVLGQFISSYSSAATLEAPEGLQSGFAGVVGDIDNGLSQVGDSLRDFGNHVRSRAEIIKSGAEYSGTVVMATVAGLSIFGAAVAERSIFSETANAQTASTTGSSKLKPDQLMTISRDKLLPGVNIKPTNLEASLSGGTSMQGGCEDTAATKNILDTLSSTVVSLCDGSPETTSTKTPDPNSAVAYQGKLNELGATTAWAAGLDNFSQPVMKIIGNNNLVQVTYDCPDNAASNPGAKEYISIAQTEPGSFENRIIATVTNCPTPGNLLPYLSVSSKPPKYAVRGRYAKFVTTVKGKNIDQLKAALITQPKYLKLSRKGSMPWTLERRKPTFNLGSLTNGSQILEQKKLVYNMAVSKRAKLGKIVCGLVSFKTHNNALNSNNGIYKTICTKVVKKLPRRRTAVK